MSLLGRRWIVVLAVLLLAQPIIATNPAIGGQNAEVPERVEPDDGGPPPSGPGHGVNNSTWWKLWSGDTDNPNLNVSEIGEVNKSAQAAREMANASDFVFARPPKAVETWNDGEHGEWNGTNRNKSRYPRGTDLKQGQVIKDAYIRILSMGPSTIVHRQNNTSQWIAPHGRTLAIVDYRVEVPENESSSWMDGNKTVFRWTNWTFATSKIGEETLSANGTEFARTSGEFAPNFTYYSVPSNANTLETNFTVQANIEATLVRTNRTCSDYNTTSGTCNGTWDRDIEVKDYKQTVEDQRHVQVQRLDDVEIMSFRYRYKDLTGVRVKSDEPWSAINVTPHETVRSTWWFYTRQKSDDWSTMYVNKRLTKSPDKSDLRPLEVHAVPTQYKPSVQPNGSSKALGNLTLEGGRAPERKAPKLPSEINVELAKNYRPVQNVRLRSNRYEEDDYRSVTIRGVVRGVKEERDPNGAIINPIGKIKTDRDPIESNDSVVAIDVYIYRTDSGWLLDRGTVIMGEKRKELDGNLSLTFYFDRPLDGPITVRYEHAEWKEHRMAFGDAEKTINREKAFPDPEYLIQIILVTILWLLPLGTLIYGVDRVTGGKLLGREEKYQS